MNQEEQALLQKILTNSADYSQNPNKEIDDEEFVVEVQKSLDIIRMILDWLKRHKNQSILRPFKRLWRKLKIAFGEWLIEEGERIIDNAG